MCSPVPVTSPGSKCTREWHRWSRWGVGWKVGMSLVTFIEYYIYILPPKQTWSQGPWKRVYSIVLGVFGLCSTLHGFWWKKWYGHLAAKGFFFFLFGTWPMGIDGLHVVEVRQRPGFCLIREWNLPSKKCWSGDFLLQTTMLINYFWRWVNHLWYWMGTGDRESRNKLPPTAFQSKIVAGVVAANLQWDRR